ncbi:ArsR/SmtB family transcription factor [Rhizobium sp. Leaf341]|uniref:ArsR/SmtB family transcription factor n=1 Tax=Rhizobium sp. Leaf341 TaxID=1736344 RepID=UPI0009EB0881
MTEDEAYRASALLRALRNTQRIKILNALLETELTVGQLAAMLGISHTSTCQHLGKLKSAGLIDQRRQSQRRYCSLSPSASEFALQVIAIAASQTPPERLRRRRSMKSRAAQRSIESQRESCDTTLPLSRCGCDSFANGLSGEKCLQNLIVLGGLPPAPVFHRR